MFQTSRRYYRRYFFQYFLILVMYIGCHIVSVIFVKWYGADEYYYFPLDGILFFEEQYENYPFQLAKTFPQVVDCDINRVEVDGNHIFYTGHCYLHYSRWNQLFMSIVIWLSLLLSLILILELVWNFVMLLCRPARVSKDKLEISEQDQINAFVNRISTGYYLFINLLLKNLPVLTVIDIITEAVHNNINGAL